MTYSVFRQGRELVAFSQDGIKKTDPESYRFTYWTRRTGEDPSRFSYWEIATDYKLGAQESDGRSSKLLRASQYELSVGTYKVSSNYERDDSPFFERVKAFIERGVITDAMRSEARDPCAALEWAHLVLGGHGIPTLEDYSQSRAIAGPFENQVLYAMCGASPFHHDAYVSAGKITAIGRIYAASPDRGSGGWQDGETLAVAIGRGLVHSDIDVLLASVQFQDRISSENLGLAVQIHGLLVERVSEAIAARVLSSSEEGEEDDAAWDEDEDEFKARKHQSFASKYLHFHRPNLFPIMDSFAKHGLRCVGVRGAFLTYKDFCEGVLTHAQSVDEVWTPRSLDTALVARGRLHVQDDAKACSACGKRRGRSL